MSRRSVNGGDAGINARNLGVRGWIGEISLEVIKPRTSMNKLRHEHRHPYPSNEPYQKEEG
jgi:hypothetical protein